METTTDIEADANTGQLSTRTANRREVLKAASALAAAFAIGDVAFNGGVETAMAAFANGLTVEIPELAAVFAVNSFQFGIGRGVSSPVGGSAEREASAPSFSEVVITKQLDKYTALLQYEAIAGDALPMVKFTFTHFVKDKAQVLGTITLTDVLVSGASFSSGGDVASSSESISMNYAGIQVNMAGNSYSWNLATNAPL